MKPKAGLGSEESVTEVVTHEPAPDYVKAFNLIPDRKANSEAAEQWTKGIQAYLQTIGRRGGKIGGKATTPAKRRASRENGKLGGRPPKRK